MIEMVMVIVIMGVIGGMVAVFLKSPIDAYTDSGRRAALTDMADTSARRMARDISKALPNSIRQVIGPIATPRLGGNELNAIGVRRTRPDDLANAVG